jgi:hypothetical protein
MLQMFCRFGESFWNVRVSRQSRLRQPNKSIRTAAVLVVAAYYGSSISNRLGVCVIYFGIIIQILPSTSARNELVQRD